MRKTTYPFLLAVIIAMLGAFMSAGLVVSAQNSNSSTTMTNTNTNTSKPRRTKPKPKPSPEAAAGESGTIESSSASTPARTGRCDPNQHEQTDLSGTYTGKIQHGDEVRDATLTISGNSLTMTSGSDTHTGRITAVTTCGYTAVTIMHGDGGMSEPGKTAPPNKVISLRAKRVGNSLTLMSVPGEPEKVMFTSGGGARRPRRQRTRKPAAQSTKSMPSDSSAPAPVRTPTPE